MSQAFMKKRSTSHSLRQGKDARTVLLRMAHDEARAKRIRSLKDRFPDLKWREIADYVGVRERSVYAWPKTGGIDRTNVKKLAEFFQRELGAADVTAEWIWRGDTETPDLMNTLNGERSQLDRIEKML